MNTQRPIPSDDEHVVLKFRPRTSARPPSRREETTTASQVASDLSRYERDREEPDDFRQRMLANIAAGEVVGKLGTATISISDLAAGLDSLRR